MFKFEFHFQINCKGSGGFRKKREIEGTYSETQNTDKTVSMGPIHVEVDQELLDFYANGYVDEDGNGAVYVLNNLLAFASMLFLLLNRLGQL